MKNVTNTYSGLDEIIVESEQLTREIDRLLEREATSFVCRCTYWVGGDRSVTVSAKFSLVQDTYGDVLGIMIVAKRIKEIKQLQSFYRITRREGQILQQLIAGLTYNEMTTLLHITRNTLKRHIANIYIKLGVNNRVELFNLLREYNLIPADKADRTILLSSNSTS
jgi:DNA-binding CsgD family transcriptional regulator